jgi:hypothetical protein
LTLCPSRIVNPTYTPAHPLPTDYTWGCPPGYLCRPRHFADDGECNFNVGPPASTYYCSPDECIPSPQLLPPQFWGTPVISHDVGEFNVSSLTYFNLNPRDFGLGYGIFQFPWAPEHSARDLTATVPPECFDECNDSMLEAESVGKSPDLCQAGSAFRMLHRACMKCVNFHGWATTTSDTLPDFQQFLFYCDNGGLNRSTATSMVSHRTTTSEHEISTQMISSARGKPKPAVIPAASSGPISKVMHNSSRQNPSAPTPATSSPFPTTKASTSRLHSQSIPTAANTGHLQTSSTAGQGTGVVTLHLRQLKWLLCFWALLQLF